MAGPHHEEHKRPPCKGCTKYFIITAAVLTFVHGVALLTLAIVAFETPEYRSFVPDVWLIVAVSVGGVSALFPFACYVTLGCCARARGAQQCLCVLSSPLPKSMC